MIKKFTHVQIVNNLLPELRGQLVLAKWYWPELRGQPVVVVLARAKGPTGGGGIGCKICNNWYHSSCQNLNANALKTFEIVLYFPSSDPLGGCCITWVGRGACWGRWGGFGTLNPFLTTSVYNLPVPTVASTHWAIIGAKGGNSCAAGSPGRVLAFKLRRATAPRPQ
jgi:hypothetical protein